MAGCIDLWESRRDLFDRCDYWHRNETYGNLAEFVQNKKVDGCFYAREETPKSSGKQNGMGAFLYDASSVTLKTVGHVDVKAGDVVRHRGELWRVEDVQERREDRETQFLKEPSVIAYVRIRK